MIRNENVNRKNDDLDIYNNRHCAMAARLDEQAQARHALARRERGLAHTVLIVVAILLGLLAVSVLKPYVGGIWIVALMIAVIIHLCLGGGIEAIIFGKSTGNGGSVIFGTIATVAAVGLLLAIAVGRAAHMVEAGRAAGVAAVLSATIAFFECGLPALIGWWSATKSEKTAFAREDVVFFKELHGQVLTAPEDAGGLFEDAKDELREQIQEKRADSNGSIPARNAIARLEERLRTLRKSDPGKRFRRGEEGEKDETVSPTAVKPSNGILSNSKVI